ncbi:hypothetical protein C8R45DRAFT_1176493 [Mycena sanguinolenta]|nr:hypothetical protein C8R45DRAFT_1176493 [Mycena sanguinolenta]
MSHAREPHGTRGTGWMANDTGDKEGERDETMNETGQIRNASNTSHSPKLAAPLERDVRIDQGEERGGGGCGGDRCVREHQQNGGTMHIAAHSPQPSRDPRRRRALCRSPTDRTLHRPYAPPTVRSTDRTLHRPYAPPTVRSTDRTLHQPDLPPHDMTFWTARGELCGHPAQASRTTHARFVGRVSERGSGSGGGAFAASAVAARTWILKTASAGSGKENDGERESKYGRESERKLRRKRRDGPSSNAQSRQCAPFPVLDVLDLRASPNPCVAPSDNVKRSHGWAMLERVTRRRKVKQSEKKEDKERRIEQDDSKTKRNEHSMREMVGIDVKHQAGRRRLLRVCMTNAFPHSKLAKMNRPEACGGAYRFARRRRGRNTREWHRRFMNDDYGGHRILGRAKRNQDI